MIVYVKTFSFDYIDRICVLYNDSSLFYLIIKECSVQRT